MHVSQCALLQSREQGLKQRCMIGDQSSRWWFEIFFIFTPKIGEDFQFDGSHIFQMGGEKPPTSLGPFICPSKNRAFFGLEKRAMAQNEGTKETHKN